MPKKKRKTPHKPSTPTQWDMGPDTPAQRAGKVVEDANWIDPETGEKRNPNGVKRARRIDLMESWHRRGILSKAELNAAHKIREAYEANFRGPPAIKEIQVDASPKPDANIAIQIDRMSRYASLMGLVRPEHREIVFACVQMDRTPAHLGFKGRRYQEGQDLVKEALGIVAERLDGKSKRG